MVGSAMRAFNLVRKWKANGLIEVSKYVSPRSGLTVTIADVEGPMVHGYLCLATETDSDDGLPHTLEHLVFMGSKQYPYKGVLDLLANRCLASGTNAWTAQDHTCYTLSTAGVDGFLKLLPIYINHILQPMLTDSQFLTEVHHINGEGENTGVVYSEMQEHESKMSDMTERAVKEAVYPHPSPYSVETGGRLHNLRTSCSNQRVREYHKSYYRLCNLNLIVSGAVNHDEVLSAVEPEERRILDDGAGIQNGVAGNISAEWKKPFRTPIPPLDKVTELTLECPSDDVTRGMVRVAWRGPSAMDVVKTTAVDVLGDYLSDTAVSPLERDFVQIQDPYCSSVGFCMDENWECCVEMRFSGVPVEKLPDIQPRLRKTLDGLISGSDAFDLERMTDLIRQKILRSRSSLETSPDSVISDMIIGDFLYGETKEHFEQRLNDVGILKVLKSESAEYWTNLLEEFFAPERKYVAIIGSPSSEYVERASGEEKGRLSKQKETLGDKGLKLAQETLDKALHENEEAEPPEELINECVVNSLSGIKFVKLQSSTNMALDGDTNERFPLRQDFPFTAMVDDVKTNFVEIYAALDTRTLSQSERPLLALWQNILFESPIKREGGVIPYEEVVKELNRDLVDYSASIGALGSKFMRVATLEIKVSDEDYEKGVCWLKDILEGVVFESERIKVVAQRLANAASAKKRNGHLVAQFLLDHITLEKGSNKQLCHLIRLEKFHEDLVKRMETEPESVVKELSKLHEKLTRPDSVAVHIMCNTEKLGEAGGDKDLCGVWRRCFKKEGGGERAEILAGREPLYLDSSVKGRGAIVTIGACEAAHILVKTEGIRDGNHPDLPALMLFLQYLDQCEGPLWKQIRGKGLAYGANVTPLVDSGEICLRLYRAAQPVQAYQETLALIEEFLKGEEEMELVEFEAAKRSLVFEIIEREETVSAASCQSLLSYFRGVDKDYNLELCKRIWEVSDVEEVVSAGKKWVSALLDPGTANMAITSHPSKLAEIQQGFQKMGWELEVLNLEDEELCRWDYA